LGTEESRHDAKTPEEESSLERVDAVLHDRLDFVRATLVKNVV
jgi:hypothetical protein